MVYDNAAQNTAVHCIYIYGVVECKAPHGGLMQSSQEKVPLNLLKNYGDPRLEDNHQLTKTV